MGDVGEKIVGLSAVEFYGIKDDSKRVEKLAKKAQWRHFTMTIRARLDHSDFSNKAY